MIAEGQVVLFELPHTDRDPGKLRPALVLRKCPGMYGDWLICMISSQLRHEIAGVDELMRVEDVDFAQTGLKVASLVRTTRLAVVDSAVLAGAIGTLSSPRLDRIRRQIGRWVAGD